MTDAEGVSFPQHPRAKTELFVIKAERSYSLDLENRQWRIRQP